LAIFVDGCFWHGCPVHGTLPKANAEWWRDKLAMNIERDRDTDRRLVVNGWHVQRFWEHENASAAAEIVRQRLQDITGTTAGDA
jgi:DNA mismatch endonuclease (patch repair protein)